MFDADKTITLSGTVKEIEWANPHVWLYIMVPDASGKPQEYALEMQGPGQSVRLGWKPDSVKPGDKVTVDLHPLRTGSRGGQLLSGRAAERPAPRRHRQSPQPLRRELIAFKP